MSDVKFGLVEYKDKVAGVTLENIKLGKAGQTAELMDEEGNITQIDVFGKKRTLQADGSVKTPASASALAVGATLTVDEIPYKISQIEETRSHTGHHKMSVSASAPEPVAAPPAG